jgi:Zn-dependent peptidase ImmA (M78 family)
MTQVPVSPELLRWAAERSGLGFARLERDFPKLPAWVRNEAHPTLRQLEEFARKTRTPIGYLFLPKPPVEPLPIPDYRTSNREALQRPSVDLLDTIYLCQQRQEWFREHARLEALPNVPLFGSARLGDEIQRTANTLRQAIGFDLEQRKHDGTWTDSLRRFIAQVEAAGILVMVAGVVGSNSHRHLDPNEFRGFALADAAAPLIFINGADSKAAQMFTLAHELAHIAVAQSAISDATPADEEELNAVAADVERVEHWCNQVAAELLVPSSVLKKELRLGSELRGEAQRLARIFKVSTLVMLRRIYDVGGSNREQFWAAYNAELEHLKNVAESTGGGGDFYLTLGARVGKRFSRAIVTSVLEGRSSFTDAFRLLGFKKMATFQSLVQELGIRS